jgi:hypothetical protein
MQQEAVEITQKCCCCCCRQSGASASVLVRINEVDSDSHYVNRKLLKSLESAAAAAAVAAAAAAAAAGSLVHLPQCLHA